MSTAVLLVVALTACNRGPTTPGGGAATLSRIELVAPQQIAPGESVQLRVNAVSTTGSVENVTARSQFGVSSEVVRISAAGLATGQDAGEVVVTAQFEGRSATARLIVMPHGTFRLTGRILEEGTATPVEQATVTVIAGVGAGLRSTSSADGFYALYGVGGPVTISVEKSGYGAIVYPLDLLVSQSFDFSIARGSHLGRYTFTLHTGSCPLNFPEAARRRVYTAEVSSHPNPGGDSLTFSLSGADFIVSNGNGNSFTGSITPRDAVMNLFEGDCYYAKPCGYQLVERYGEGALAVRGQGWGKGTLDFASGPFFGDILIFAEQRAPFTTVTSSCRVDRFELVRR